MQEDYKSCRDALYESQIAHLVSTQINEFKKGFVYHDKEIGSDGEEAYQKIKIIASQENGSVVLIEMICGDPNDPFEIIHITAIESDGKWDVMTKKVIDAEHYSSSDIQFYLTEALVDFIDETNWKESGGDVQEKRPIGIFTGLPIDISPTPRESGNKPHLALVVKDDHLDE